jgi:hypothetical protein
MLPLRIFDGWLKQVLGADLAEADKRVLGFIFPILQAPDAYSANKSAAYMRDINAGRASAQHIEQVVGSALVNKRRFAGDHTLSASNYHTVSHDDRGDDMGTLIAELYAYRDDQVGAIGLHDLVTKQQADELGVEPRDRSFLIRLGGTPGQNAAIAFAGTDSIWIPYRVQSARIPDVIDLRFPEVQAWFCKEFSDFHRFTWSMLEEGKRPGAVLPEWPSTWQPATFLEMLPVLMNPEFGGNIVTDHIGQWLRMHGVAGLVYPSARTTSGVIWNGNEMRRFLGWNFVDYRGRDRQLFRATTIIVGGAPWSSEHARHFDLQVRDESWVMAPPKFSRIWARPVPDEYLMLRFRAAQDILAGLITLSAKHQNATEVTWLQAMLAACETDRGRRILAYMGIEKVIDFSQRGSSDPALLFECWSHATASSRISKGFACLTAPPGHARANLNAEPEDCTTGDPAFALVEDGMYLYYLREDA